MSHEDIASKYEFQQDLGAGTFSTVWLGKSTDEGDLSAIKQMDKHNAKFDWDMLQTEVEILSSVDHPNIIKLQKVFETEDHYYMVLEYVTGGELFDHIVERGSYGERCASVIMEGMFAALEHLHSHSIVHRDLKPENILCKTKDDDSPIKIADFGLSKVLREDIIVSTACGTPAYVAPEVLKRPKDGYDFEVDMWSSGVIMYILLCGFPPFYEENQSLLFRQIMKGDYEFISPYWDEVSDPAKDLISKLLVVDPTQRLTVAQALQHPWVQGRGVPDTQLHTARTELVKWNAKRKLKGAVEAVMAANRMKHILESMGHTE